MDHLLAHMLRWSLGRGMQLRGVPRLLYWLRRLAFPVSPVCITTPQGIPIAIDRDDYGQLMLFYAPYAPELLALCADIVRPGDLCLDLGANVGVLTMRLAELTGAGGCVVAVEANDRVAAQLRLALAQMGYGHVVVVSAGIAGSEGMGHLHFAAPGRSESVSVNIGAGPIRLMTVDTILATYAGERKPAFIKVDIEGSEVELPEALRVTLGAGLRPVMLIELHEDQCRQCGRSTLPLRRFLESLGYLSRRVEPALDGYALVKPDSFTGTPGRENMLFITPVSLAEHRRLAPYWEAEA